VPVESLLVMAALVCVAWSTGVSVQRRRERVAWRTEREGYQLLHALAELDLTPAPQRGRTRRTLATGHFDGRPVSLEVRYRPNQHRRVAFEFTADLRHTLDPELCIRYVAYDAAARAIEGLPPETRPMNPFAPAFVHLGVGRSLALDALSWEIVEYALALPSPVLRTWRRPGVIRLETLDVSHGTLRLTFGASALGIEQTAALPMLSRFIVELGKDIRRACTTLGQATSADAILWRIACCERLDLSMRADAMRALLTPHPGSEADDALWAWTRAIDTFPVARTMAWWRTLELRPERLDELGDDQLMEIARLLLHGTWMPARPNHSPSALELHALADSHELMAIQRALAARFGPEALEDASLSPALRAAILFGLMRMGQHHDLLERAQDLYVHAMNTRERAVFLRAVLATGWADAAPIAVLSRDPELTPLGLTVVATFATRATIPLRRAGAEAFLIDLLFAHVSSPPEVARALGALELLGAHDALAALRALERARPDARLRTHIAHAREVIERRMAERPAQGGLCVVDDPATSGGLTLTVPRTGALTLGS